MREERAQSSTNQTVRKEAKSVSLYAASTFLTSIGSLLLLPLLWIKLTPADYGVIGITDILSALLGIFWGMSLEVSISRFYYDWSEKDRREKLGSVWIVAWGSAIVLGGISVALLALVNPFVFPDVQFFPYIFLGLSQGIMGRMRQIVFATIRIKQLPKLYLGYSVAIFSLILITNVTFVFFLDLGLLGYYAAWNVTEVVMLVVGALVMLRFASPRIQMRGLRESLTFALPLIPNNVISSLSSVADRILLQRFASLEALGIYTLCLRFVQIIALVSDSAKMSFAPFLYRAVSESGPAAASIIARIRMFYLIPISCAAIGIALFIDDFVHVLGQPAYFPVGDYVPLLVGPAFILTLTPYFASGMLLAKRTEMLMVPTLIQLLLVLTLGVLLVPAFQTYGIIVSRYVTMIAFVCSAIYLSQRYYPIPIDRRKLSLVLLYVSLGIVSALFDYGSSGAQNGLIHMVLFACLAGLVVITVVGPKATMGEIRRRFRRAALL